MLRNPVGLREIFSKTSAHCLASLRIKKCQIAPPLRKKGVLAILSICIANGNQTSIGLY
jgi:hypothetical protein